MAKSKKRDEINEKELKRKMNRASHKGNFYFRLKKKKDPKKAVKKQENVVIG